MIEAEAERPPGYARGMEPAPTSVAPSLRDPAQQERFERDGYLVIDHLDAAEVAELRTRFEAMYVGEREDACHRSNESLDLGYRQALHELIGEVLGPLVDDLLVDHLGYSSGTLVKWRGPRSLMPSHQDWTVVDETQFRSLSFWMPLCDVDAANGALHVLPGSQRVLDGMRPNPGIPPMLVDPAGDLDPARLQVIAMRAGQVLVFDHGVLHGSPPNTIDDPRIALVLAAVPRAATMQHLWRRPDDQVIERFEVADPEFFRHCTPGIRPDHPAIVLAEELPFRPHAPGAAEWLAEQVRPDATAAGAPVEQAAPATEVGPTAGHGEAAEPEPPIHRRGLLARLRR